MAEESALNAELPHHALPLEPAARPCSYLPGRVAVDEAWLAPALLVGLYRDLMDRNYRRSGHVVYRPRCPDCRLCRQIRVPIDTFRASRSQRRCQRRNADLRALVQRPVLTEQKVGLYARYLAHQHRSGEQASDAASLRDFLYRSCVDTIEVEYRDSDDRLLAVSLVDVDGDALSSVYHYFDPDHRDRSLGTFSALAEIEAGRAHGLSYYYLGYWIQGCRTMEYKARFRPHEVLVDGEWRRVG